MDEFDYHSKEFFEACEQMAEIIKVSRDIIELIESPQFPAYRGITDYIILLLIAIDVNRDVVKKIEETFDAEFKKRDIELYNKSIEENIHNG